MLRAAHVSRIVHAGEYRFHVDFITLYRPPKTFRDSSDVYPIYATLLTDEIEVKLA